MSFKKYLFFALIFILGCAEELETISVLENITMTVKEGPYVTAKADSSLVFNISIQSLDPLKGLEIYKDGQLLSNMSLEPVNEKEIEYEYVPQKNEADKRLIFSFVASDFGDSFTNSELIVDVIPTFLTFEKKNITLFHYETDSAYSWDIVNNCYTVDSTLSDLWIHSEASEWLEGFKSYTSSSFLKVATSDLNYDRTFTEEIDLLYEQSYPTHSLESLETDDLVIVKLRDKNSEFALIRIEQVSNYSGDNSESITISYKKVSELSGN